MTCSIFWEILQGGGMITAWFVNDIDAVMESSSPFVISLMCICKYINYTYNHEQVCFFLENVRIDYWLLIAVICYTERRWRGLPLRWQTIGISIQSLPMSMIFFVGIMQWVEKLRLLTQVKIISKVKFKDFHLNLN